MSVSNFESGGGERTPDKQFDGFDHDSLPDVDLDFSCKNKDVNTQPEAVVDIKNDNRWVRLPITMAETRVNKDGPADVTFTTRVNVPATWGTSARGDGKAQIYNYVGATNKEDGGSFDTARVYYWNQYIEEYQIQQFGYVASVGPSAESGVFKFYIYDAADMMENISVTKTYDSPSANAVVNFVAFDDDYGVEENVPVPIQNISFSSEVDIESIEGTIESFQKTAIGFLGSKRAVLMYNPVIDAVDEDLREDYYETFDDVLGSGGKKHFEKNRHTLVDVMEWLTDEIGGSWWFEPTDNGVILVVNSGEDNDFSIPRNSFYDGQTEIDDLEYTQGYNSEAVDVTHNTSLEDIKPINYLELKGETADSFLSTGFSTDRLTNIGFGDDEVGPFGGPRGQTDAFPYVEVEYPPLLERTSGRKLGPNPVESSATILSEAEQEAVQKFKAYHEDNTDGEIHVKALPTIRPYDYMAAVPVCNNTFDADMNPIQYEVNSVVHSVKADDHYTTELGVSLSINEDAIETTTEMVNIDG